MTRIARWSIPLLVACGSPPPRAVKPSEPTARVDVDATPVGEVVAEVLLDVSHQSPSCLAIDDGYLYWTHASGYHASAWRLPKSGGEPQRLAGELQGAGDCMREGDELWMTSGGGVIAVPITGGAPRRVASRSGELARGPDGIYLANHGAGLFRIGANGAFSTLTVRPIRSILGGDPVAFTTSFDLETTRDDALWRLDGNQLVELARLPGPSGALARVDGTIYVQVAEDLVNTIYAVPLAGGRPRAFVTHRHASTRIVVDAGQLWWASSQGVVRVALDEAAATLHAADAAPRGWDATRHSLVMDDASLYWLSINIRRWSGVTTAAIMRAPRR